MKIKNLAVLATMLSCLPLKSIAGGSERVRVEHGSARIDSLTSSHPAQIAAASLFKDGSVLNNLVELPAAGAREIGQIREAVYSNYIGQQSMLTMLPRTLRNYLGLTNTDLGGNKHNIREINAGRTDTNMLVSHLVFKNEHGEKVSVVYYTDKYENGSNPTEGAAVVHKVKQGFFSKIFNIRTTENPLLLERSERGFWNGFVDWDQKRQPLREDSGASVVAASAVLATHSIDGQ